MLLGDREEAQCADVLDRADEAEIDAAGLAAPATTSYASWISAMEEIAVEDLKDQKIIAFSRANLSYTERYFASLFDEHDLSRNIAYSSDDTFSLVSAGLGVGFAPEWTANLPERNFELKKVRGIDLKIGLGVAWNKEDPTAARDGIIDIARSLARPGR